MAEIGRENQGGLALGVGALLLLTLAAGSCQPASPPPLLQRMILDYAEEELGPLVQEVELASLEEHSVVSTAWEFEGDENEPRWTTLKEVVNLRVEDGSLKGIGRGSDPSVIARFEFAANDLDYLWIRMKSQRGGMGQIFWTTQAEEFMSEAKAARFTVQGGDEFVDYVLPVGANPRWRGRVRSFRVDPPPQAGRFEIDSLKVVKITAPPTGMMALSGRVGKAVLASDTRPAVFSYPPDDMTWSVSVDSGSTLEFSYGILPEAWLRPGNAVRFEVAGSHGEDGEEIELFSATVRPRTQPEDRDWQEAEVDLGDFGAGELNLTFRVRQEDEDGSPEEFAGAFAFAVWGNPRLVRRDHAQERPNIVLIGLDTIRVDRVGAYGYGLPTTPNVDRLAADSTIFERAIAQAPWTLPSFASLFTSLYPSMAGVYEASHALQAEAMTLAAMLHETGYSTVAFTGGGYAGRGWRMDRGFDRFWEGASARGMSTRLEQWLETRGPDPFFLYLHSYEAHDYFRASAEQIEAARRVRGSELDLPDDVYDSIIVGQGAGLSPEQLAEISALYDGGVWLADALVGQWLDMLEASGALERSVVVLFADHGEGFGEHGLVHHGNSLYEEMVHVPLVVRVSPTPEGTAYPRRVEKLVELVDISPTVLELAGLAAPSGAQGQSLVQYLVPQAAGADNEPAEEGHAYSEIPFHRVYALRSPAWTYIYSNRPQAYRGCSPHPDRPGERFCEELYDLRSDPGERVNLLDTAPEMLQETRARFAAFFNQATPGLRVLALGGSNAQAITIRVGGTEYRPAAEIYYAEDGDQTSEDVTSLNLAPGDLDIVSWTELDDDLLGGLILEIEPQQGPPDSIDLYTGPECDRPIAAGGLVVGSDLLQAGPPTFDVPSTSSRTRICVSYTPWRSPQPSLQEISPEALRRLRALGYVQ